MGIMALVTANIQKYEKKVTRDTGFLIFSTKMLCFSTGKLTPRQFFAYLTIIMTDRHAELATFVVVIYII